MEGVRNKKKDREKEKDSGCEWVYNINNEFYKIAEGRNTQTARAGPASQVPPCNPEVVRPLRSIAVRAQSGEVAECGGATYEEAASQSTVSRLRFYLSSVFQCR
jgi:hypothetical protein